MGITQFAVIIVFRLLLLATCLCSLSIIEAPTESSPKAPPLHLTPLLRQNRLQEARQAAQVHLTGAVTEQLTSYAGFLTVNNTYNSNLFFWFFPSQKNASIDPVLVWLQGGPGASSMLGLLMEHGPYVPNDQCEVVKRSISWTNNHSVIYIDNPVGSGFSYTKDERGYARSESDVGQNLYIALLQFFQMFPDYRRNPFFVTGESYAGKYVPQLAYTIHKNNEMNAAFKINLQGIAIGNGLCDPVHQIGYSQLLYGIGLIDKIGADQMVQMEHNTIEMINRNNYTAAFEYFDQIINGDQNPDTLFKQLTKFNFYFNYLYDKDVFQRLENNIACFLNRSEVRNALHVGTLPFGQESKIVEEYLKDDIMRSIAPLLIELLEHYRVLIYNGQLDIIVGYRLTVNFLENLNYNKHAEFLTSSRKEWRVDNELAGYSRSAGNLTEVLVRDAGHMVPYDQPKWALDLITKFTRNMEL